MGCGDGGGGGGDGSNDGVEGRREETLVTPGVSVHVTLPQPWSSQTSLQHHIPYLSQDSITGLPDILPSCWSGRIQTARGLPQDQDCSGLGEHSVRYQSTSAY